MTLNFIFTDWITSPWKEINVENMDLELKRMAKEVNWMTLPSSIHVTDPRVSQSMSELQQNSAALKGFPMLSYVNMGMAPIGQPPPGSGSDATAQTQRHAARSL